jgi:hypothetical protein
MRPLLAAVALVAASASAASAGAYLGLGIGTAASPGGELTTTSSDGNRSGRVILGTSFGRLSIEGNGDRFGLYRGQAAYQGTTLAAVLKYSLPLGDHFEVYGRGGLQRTWLNTDDNAADWAGNGWLLGAGFEYRLDLAGTGASVFVDYQHTDTGLLNQTDMKTAKDETFGMWTLGATVSL